MNAVSLAEGMRKGGVQGARDQLAKFWRAASLDGGLAPVQRDMVEGMVNFWNATPIATIFQQAAGMLSPTEMNPLNINPLRNVLAAQVDFAALRASDHLKLFIAATNVETGKVRVFHRPELTIDMVMASACLPTIFRAVEIDGVPYWDGGYMGNPVLFPFFYETDTTDVVLVQINPIARKGTPTTVAEILGRIDEITFNSSLLQEFRAIDFVARLMADGSPRRHELQKHPAACDRSAGRAQQIWRRQQMRSDYDFFVQLRDIGRKRRAEISRRAF